MPRLDQRDLDLVCEHSREAWEQLRGERIFITGGTGFFGCWLLETFAAANERYQLKAEAVVLTRAPEKFRERYPHLAGCAAIQLHRGDMVRFEAPDGDFRFVVHAAADVSAARGQRGTEPSSLKERGGLLAATFDGTRRVLDFAAEHGAQRFLMVSSGAVYGPQPAAMMHIPESYMGAPDPCVLESAYGEGKRAAENLCAAYAAAGLACAVARPFAFLGPYLPLDQGFAIGDFVRSAMAGEPILIRGDGTALRSYLYAADLALWLWQMLVHAPSLRPYNVGSSEVISIRALAEEVVSVICPGLAIEVAGVAQPGRAPAQYVPEVTRAAEELGLRQTVGLRDAIARTAVWHGWQGGGPAVR